jgi:hypothetical protein
MSRCCARSAELYGPVASDPVVSRTIAALVIVDLDATLVTSRSEKENAAPTWKTAFGPLTAFADHSPDGCGEPLAILLRPGSPVSGDNAMPVRGAHG